MKLSIRQALTGPIASIRTPFNRDGSIDFHGVRRMIGYNLAAGSKVALLTAGDSHFSLLSDEEIRQLNTVMVEHTAGRALTVACDWEFATPQAVEFAKYCAEIGADILMARPPDWASSATQETLVEHYTRIAEEIPLMLVTNIFQLRPAAFGLETVRELMRRDINIVAIKEDLTGDFACQVALLTHSRWAVFSGGGLRNFLNMFPYGCDGFMDRHMNFAPHISRRFWKAVQDRNREAVREVIQMVELPLEEFMATFPGGRDAVVHGLLELADIAGRWRRAPYHSLTDQEMGKLKRFVEETRLRISCWQTAL
jgi:4-hydroxy-tetrahydrodipicolinate synthase